MAAPSLSNLLRERKLALVLVILFAAVMIWVASVPYEPLAGDKADATTNAIWIEHYEEGVFHLPYDEWNGTYPPTQSVVVEHGGEYVVVNEKGPGHVIAMLPFRAIGAEFLFGPAMVGLAVLGAYMLGRRLFGWPTGFIAAMLVLFNLTVIVMWHRCYWTDASTMHFLVLSVWLFVEGVYRYNGRSLGPAAAGKASNRDKILGMGVLALSGLAFGAAVSTRYPTGLLVIIFPLYLLGIYLGKIWPELRKGRFAGAARAGIPALAIMGAFLLGLLLVLAPLMSYNSEYFGGPLNSGYDATSLMEFSRTGTIDVRNATSTWTGNIWSYFSTVYYNLFRLMPTFLARMPALLFLPLGMYCMRRRRLELAVLLLWIGINFFTYLSLEWVDMYARPDLMPWEPRYWMPSLPAISIIGGFGVHRLSGWLAGRAVREHWLAEERKMALKAAISGALVGALVLWSAVPAMGYLQDPTAGERPQQPRAITVTTDMLLAEPANFVNKSVILEDAVITFAGMNTIQVRSLGSADPDSVTVRLVEWPPGTLPRLSEGQHVTLRGFFHWEPRPLPESPGYSIGVKYGTEDFVKILD